MNRRQKVLTASVMGVAFVLRSPLRSEAGRRCERSHDKKKRVRGI